jgi:hypothetical protein
MTFIVLPVLVGILSSFPTSALAARYNCLPVMLTEDAKRLTVECAEPSGFEGGLPRDASYRIRYFSVRKSEIDTAARFEHMVQTALVSGLVVHFMYTSGTHDPAIGCAIDDCRLPFAFSLLAASTGVRIPFAEWPSSAAVSIATGEWKFYGPFSISEFRKLVVTMTGTGDADLYVRKDDPPDTGSYTCRPYLSTSNESCTIAPPVDPKDPKASRGTYYVGVRGKINSTFLLTVSIETR